MTLWTEKDDWKLIKGLSWYKFPNQQIYLDEEEQVIVMKRKSGSIVVAMYLWLEHTKFISIGNFISMINEIKEWGYNKWGSNDISIILNFRLSILFFSDIEKLPKDVKYFHIEGKQIYLQDVAANIECSKTNFDGKVRLVSRKNHIDIDDESQIMQALKNGNAEGFGF